VRSPNSAPRTAAHSPAKPPRSLRDQNALARLIKGVPTDELVDAGVVKLDGANAIAGLIAATKKTRIWDRAPKVRNVP
jgi:hypothetical protein